MLHTTYLIRGLWTWALIRGALTLMLSYAGGPPPPALPPFGRMIVLGAVMAVGLAELHRRREWDLLGNLGVAHHTVLAWLALPVLVGEVLLLLVLA